MLMSEKCNLCPNNCNVDRQNFVGRCTELNNMRIAKFYPHPFEEPFISGTKGSGTVFFSGCSLKCAFCQNFELSRSTRGKSITAHDLEDIFKQLEGMGVHNINLVNPTHFVDKIYEAVKIYHPNVPIVYNTHGYESKTSLDIALKFVDVFLPDLKFKSPTLSKRYTGIANYFEVASSAILKMMQERPTQIKNGLILKGTCVRHLILPLAAKDSIEIINWFEQNALNESYISIMSQYTPFGEIDKFAELKRPITKGEYERVLQALMQSSITNCYIQDRTSASEKFIPKWDF